MSYESDVFFEKTPKFFVNFKNAIKLAKNLIHCEENFGWTCWWTFSQLWQEYLWLAVNMLENGPDISDPTRRHDTQLNFLDINGK